MNAISQVNLHEVEGCIDVLEEASVRHDDSAAARNDASFANAQRRFAALDAPQQDSFATLVAHGFRIGAIGLTEALIERGRALGFPCDEAIAHQVLEARVILREASFNDARIAGHLDAAERVWRRLDMDLGIDSGYRTCDILYAADDKKARAGHEAWLERALALVARDALDSLIVSSDQVASLMTGAALRGRHLHAGR